VDIDLQVSAETVETLNTSNSKEHTLLEVIFSRMLDTTDLTSKYLLPLATEFPTLSGSEGRDRGEWVWDGRTWE
jgi:hypothetical protein